jgi:hypothetical protein
MKKPHDLIFYGGGLYEITNETEKQYCLTLYLNFAESKLGCGWVDKDALSIGCDRIPGNDWSKIQLAMVEVYKNAPCGYDPIP